MTTDSRDPPFEDMHGYWVRAFALVDIRQERYVNTFFDRENAERKKRHLIESWEEHTEDTMSIVEILEDVS